MALCGSFLAVLIIGGLAYSNTLHGEFLFDDTISIPDNTTIRSIWPPAGPLSPPAETSVEGRPVVNVTLALNYAIGGLDVRGFHLVNLALHLFAGLVLFDLVRRTLQLELFGGRFEQSAVWLALAIALLWVAHPLTTAAVSYIIQRAEVLVALFYLLTLYCLLRGATGVHRKIWYAGSALACCLGMASKEVMVSAPVMALLFDIVFLSRSWREAWRARRWLYAGLFASWLLLAWLLTGSASRGGTAGFDTEITPWQYALTQAPAIVEYLRLCFWPRPLVFDYGYFVSGSLGEVWLAGLMVMALLAATGVLIYRVPALGYPAVLFFAVLAPSSSFVPVATQTAALHRMYLPLASVVTLVVVGASLLGTAAFGRLPSGPARIGNVVLSAVVVAAVSLFAWMTFQRNRDFQSEYTIWLDTVAKVPGSPRAHFNLGSELEKRGQDEDAAGHFRRTLELCRDNRLGVQATTLARLGVLLCRHGKTEEGLALCRQAIKLAPAAFLFQSQLGEALHAAGRQGEAIQAFRRAVELQPTATAARVNLGRLLKDAGKLDAAEEQFREAWRQDPRVIGLAEDLMQVLLLQGKQEEAIALFGARAIESGADSPDVLGPRAIALARRGEVSEALKLCERALALDPRSADLYVVKSSVQRMAGDGQAAKQSLETAIELDARHVVALTNLGGQISQIEPAAAIDLFQRALDVDPTYAEAHNNLANALARQGRFDQAIEHYERALQSEPELVSAQRNLEVVRQLKAAAEQRAVPETP